jgi:hypothetical protein
VGQRFSRLVGGPIVLVGEEVVRPSYHLIAAGITTTVSFMQSAADAIDEVHRQGGVAIAAHPDTDFWEGFDRPAMQRLDGSEICHPSALVPEFVLKEDVQRNYEAFAARAPSPPSGLQIFASARWGCAAHAYSPTPGERGILDGSCPPHGCV